MLGGIRSFYKHNELLEFLSREIKRVQEFLVGKTCEKLSRMPRTKRENETPAVFSAELPRILGLPACKLSLVGSAGDLLEVGGVLLIGDLSFRLLSPP